MKTFTPDSSIVSDVIPSVNFGERANNRQPDMIVLHYTGMPDNDAAARLLCNPAAEVSAHYLVLQDGHPAGQVTSAAWGETVGACVGLAWLRVDGPLTPDRLASAARRGTGFEVDVAGTTYPLRVSLRAPLR